MALDKDILGTALYNVRQSYVNRTYNDLVNQYGNMNAARLAQAKDEADAIINHFITDGVVNVSVATTGTASAQTGTGTGTIL